MNYRQQAESMLIDMIDRGALIVRDTAEWDKLVFMGECALMRGRSEAIAETSEALRKVTEAID